MPIFRFSEALEIAREQMEKTKKGDQVGRKRVERLFQDAENAHPEAAERFIQLEMKDTDGIPLTTLERREIEIHKKNVRSHLLLRNWLYPKE